MGMGFLEHTLDERVGVHAAGGGAIEGLGAIAAHEQLDRTVIREADGAHAIDVLEADHPSPLRHRLVTCQLFVQRRGDLPDAVVARAKANSAR